MKNLLNKSTSILATAALSIIGAAFAGLGLLTLAVLICVALGAAMLGVLARPLVENKVKEATQQSPTT